jgi:predicted metal-dependent peptidase
MQHDSYQLQRMLDQTKSSVFLGKSAAFLGSISSNLEFIWDNSIPTAGTDGTKLWWNPDYFLGLPPKSRNTDYMHELWHVALLHGVRRDTRDPKQWNIACDVKIDLMLEDEGYSFDGIKGVLTFPDLNARQYAGWVEEDIYDDLVKNNFQPPPKYECDMVPGGPGDKHAVINSVVRAVHQAKLANAAGSIPGGIEEMLNNFLSPVVPWETLLRRWFTDMLDEDYTWKRPNRRYSDMYLPSRFLDDGRLKHLVYYQDVSGSVSNANVHRFNSELSFVWKEFKPQKMTVVQFDTKIQKIDEFKEGDTFNEIKIVGRGGTDLRCVREHIMETKPTAAIIFSDLECPPMRKLDFDIPVIWVVVGNKEAGVNFGHKIHIT